jgi:hypothetical protein
MLSDHRSPSLFALNWTTVITPTLSDCGEVNAWVNVILPFNSSLRVYQIGEDVGFSFGTHNALILGELNMLLFRHRDRNPASIRHMNPFELIKQIFAREKSAVQNNGLVKADTQQTPVEQAQASLMSAVGTKLVELPQTTDFSLEFEMESHAGNGGAIGIQAETGILQAGAKKEGQKSGRMRIRLRTYNSKSHSESHE